MAHHDDDFDTNVSANPHISAVIGERLLDPARRTILKSGLGMGALSFMEVSASFLSGCLEDARGPKLPDVLSLDAVPKSLADAVTVPAGSTATVLHRLADPFEAGIGEYASDGTDAAATLPGGPGTRPRSATMVITRDDGGVIGV